MRRGFEVYVGGGLGSYPVVASKFFDFLPVEDLLRFSEAVLRVFDRYGERKVRMKARMKFLIEKWGFEKFREMVQNEIKTVQLPQESNGYLKHIQEWEERPPRTPPSLQLPKAGPQRQEGGADFLVWKKTNVTPQKQSGYSMVEVKLRTGDMKPKEMRQLATLLRKYVGGKLRTMVHQNLLIRWARNQDLPAIYQELKNIGMADPDAQTIYDVTSCPGTDSCRLGITSSMGLARVLEERLYKEDGKIAEAARSLRIKISGCPNSCGQHHIANIGFYGGAISVNGHTAPAFQLVLGGNYGCDTEMATPICQIPSRNIPDAVIRLVRHFSEKRGSAEGFNDFYGRLGKEAVVKLLGDFLKIPLYKDRSDFYVDWESQQEFALQKGVIGECAGQMREDVTPQVSDGGKPLETARALLSHGDFIGASNKAYESIVKSANGLLYHWLVATFNDIETTHEFENQFVARGMFPEWNNFHRSIQGLRKKTVDEAIAKEWISKAASFLKVCQEKEPEVAGSSPRKGVTAAVKPDHLAV
ncbi:MAG: nitrite/sulfite reductase [Deltaproteobacteria bacterium]|nr:nitrite/sulfite reductase [Deltaproteobacteria bacterium]